MAELWARRDCCTLSSVSETLIVFDVNIDDWNSRYLTGNKRKAENEHFRVRLWFLGWFWSSWERTCCGSSVLLCFVSPPSDADSMAQH